MAISLTGLKFGRTVTLSTSRISVHPIYIGVRPNYTQPRDSAVVLDELGISVATELPSSDLITADIVYTGWSTVVPESVGLIDAPILGVGIDTGIESISLGDEIDVLKSFDLTFYDTCDVGDNVTANRLFTRYLADTVNTADSFYNATNNIHDHSDQANIGDSVQSEIVYVRSISDSVSLTDTATPSLGLNHDFVPGDTNSLALQESITITHDRVGPINADPLNHSTLN